MKHVKLFEDFDLDRFLQDPDSEFAKNEDNPELEPGDWVESYRGNGQLLSIDGEFARVKLTGSRETIAKVPVFALKKIKKSSVNTEMPDTQGELRQIADQVAQYLNILDGDDDLDSEMSSVNPDAVVNFLQDILIDIMGSLPTSTLVYPGQSTSSNYVMYCFAPVAGYSSFGSYTGNGSADGPFVHLGFLPRWIMIKQSSASGENWEICDALRNGYNFDNTNLYANLSASEAGSGGANTRYDILSTGFKIRSSTPGVNATGATYIYAAFSEVAFNFARGR